MFYLIISFLVINNLIEGYNAISLLHISHHSWSCTRCYTNSLHCITSVYNNTGGVYVPKYHVSYLLLITVLSA